MLRKLFKGRDPAAPREGATESASAPPEPTSSGLAAAVLALPRDAALAHIAGVTDPDTLLSLALDLRGALRDAVLAHPILCQPAQLAALEKRSRNRDKAINRHARQRLDEYRRLQQEAAALRARASELATALSRHDGSSDDRTARERLRALAERLQDAVQRHQTLNRRLAVFGAQLADLEVPAIDPAEFAPAPAAATAAPPQGAPTAAPMTALDDPFTPLVAAFEALDAAMHQGRPFAELAAERQSLTERWLTAADHQPPAANQHQVFEAVSHRFRELADAIERLLRDAPATLPEAALGEAPADARAAAAFWQAVEERRRLVRRLEQGRQRAGWPAWAPPVPEYRALLDAEERLRADVAAAQRQLDERLQALDRAIRELTDAIDGGHLVPAREALARAHTAHDAIPPAAARQLSPRLGQQAARLAELKDWQTFATTPKREALVDAMAALAREPLAPPAQADRIKALRREWQALGPVTQARDGRLADRFNTEADAAFEPCRAYFAEQAERRRANLGERERICDQLEGYLDDTDWAHADMQAAERIMRAAREEWRAFHPVERTRGKAVEARFEALQDRLHDKVKAEWERNVRTREALVAEAGALLDEASLPVAEKIERIKTLQHRWRDVGITPHGPNQRLWRQFRQACDAVFAARDQSRQQADAERAALIDEVRGALDAFAERLQSLAPEQASEADLRAFRTQVEALERLPAAQRRDLAARRGDLLERYRALLDGQRQARARARLDELERDDATSGGGPAADFAALRRLTVRAEIAAGLPSPVEDERLRLEVQVERLRDGFSGGGDSERAEALLARWQGLGSKDAAAQPLRQRFFAALRLLG
jgi:DNA repair protein SbcC/Rad50